MSSRFSAIVVPVALAFVTACGNGRSLPTTIPSPTPVPIPTPTPTPSPTPTPAPAPTPTPCPPGVCEDPVTNTNPVAKLNLRLYFVEDKEGRVTELSENDEIPRDHLIHLDATAKDADNKETGGRGDNPQFFFSGDLHLVVVSGNHPYQRKVKVIGGPGVVMAEAELEKVRSNPVRLKLQ